VRILSLKRVFLEEKELIQKRDGQQFNGDSLREKLELNQFSIVDWRIIKEVYKRPLSLQEIQKETKFTYRQVYHNCKKLHKWGYLNKLKDAVVIYSAPSSKELRQDVMDRYYDIMEA
jgi:predicted DNA-binding protein YlxM (UPF0122 family)